MLKEGKTLELFPKRKYPFKCEIHKGVSSQTKPEKKIPYHQTYDKRNAKGIFKQKENYARQKHKNAGQNEQQCKVNMWVNLK